MVSNQLFDYRVIPSDAVHIRDMGQKILATVRTPRVGLAVRDRGVFGYDCLVHTHLQMLPTFTT